MDIARATRAHALLNDADATAALYEIETTLIKQWRDARTTEAREAAWHELNGLTLFRAKLKIFASDLSFAPKGDAR